MSLLKDYLPALAFVTIPLARSEKAMRNPGTFGHVVARNARPAVPLVGSEELLTTFIGLELLGFRSIYQQRSTKDRRLDSAEAGAESIFLFGRTASAFILFGISLIYGMMGTTVPAR